MGNTAEMPAIEELELSDAAYEKELLQERSRITGKKPKKRHLNVVLIGPPGAGKSTTAGQMLFLSGQVDYRTIQEYREEAIDRNRESCYMAYLMDTTEEERAEGRTIEVGNAKFETEETRFTIFDAPGLNNFVPRMVISAYLADVGVLVISAVEGEYEGSYQIDEHVKVARAMGVENLVIVVNKMDDPTINWSKEKYHLLVLKLRQYLCSLSRYSLRTEVQFLPISGLLGINMKTRVDESICSWWRGPSLFEALEDIEVEVLNPNAINQRRKHPFRMPIIDKFKDMELGIVVIGRVEVGVVCEGSAMLVMPKKACVEVLSISCGENEVKHAGPNEFIWVRLSGVEEEDILSGSVLSSILQPIPVVTQFSASLRMLRLSKMLFSAGCKAFLHIHAAIEECEVVAILGQHDFMLPGIHNMANKIVRDNSIVHCIIQVNNPVCIEMDAAFPNLRRFVLRVEGRTIAEGCPCILPFNRNRVMQPLSNDHMEPKDVPF